MKMRIKKLKKMTHRVFALTVCAAMITLAPCSPVGVISAHAENAVPAAGEVRQGSLNVTYHTQQEISARMKNDGISLEAPLNYAITPELAAPYSNAGMLSPDTLDNAIRTLNQIRYIAGLNDNVTLNDEYNRKAQAASLVNCANRQLSHDPARPAGMNDAMYLLGADGASSSNIAMASWQASLNWIITHCWMEDGDSSNIDRVGHRRWLLNPSMGSTGFGAVSGPTGTYYAVYCFDKSDASASQTQVAWPAQNMPVQYFDPVFPWSISIGSSVDINSVTVLLRRVNDGMVWQFSSANSNGYFNVNNTSYGQKGCIIFRPDGITGYNAGDKFEVMITGSGINLFYTVDFFDPDSVEPAITPIDILNTIPDCPVS